MFEMNNLSKALGDLTIFNIFVLVSLCFFTITFILTLISLCKIFSKASKTDIFALVPFLNLWIWFEICGIRGFWSLIPIINIILFFISLFKIPARFGKKKIYGLGILFIPYLFLAYIAFDKSVLYDTLKVVKTKNKMKENKQKKDKKKTKEIEILELEDFNDDIEVLELEGEIIEIFDESELEK